jgi:outer membrane protein W
MKRRLLVSCMAVALFAGFIDPPTASAQQSVNFFVGAFVPRGFNARDTNDVLFQNAGFLDFRIRDFNGVTAGAEYLVQLGDFFDAGLGVGIYSQTQRAADLDFQHPNGALIEQDMKLRIIPVTATIRFLPIGHHDAIVPYVGGGVGIYRWRYSETGEFLDTQNNIFSGSFEASDTTVGPVVLGGVRVPVGSKGSGFGGEIRWQGGKGDLPLNQGFAGTKIDLGGFNYLFTVNVGF